MNKKNSSTWRNLIKIIIISEIFGNNFLPTLYHSYRSYLPFSSLICHSLPVCGKTCLMYFCFIFDLFRTSDITHTSITRLIFK